MDDRRTRSEVNGAHSRWRSRLLALVISTLVWALVADLYFDRCWPIDELVFELDARRLYRPVPHARNITWIASENGGGHVVSRFNSLGLRGAELEPRSAHAHRIVVYGDSFVNGLETPLEDTFVVRLRQELERRGVDVETVNAGVSGYGPDQSLLKFEEEVDLLEPDLVLFAICAENDFWNLSTSQIFTLDSGGSLLETHVAADAPYIERYERRRRLGQRCALVRVFNHLLAAREAQGPLRTFGLEEKDDWRRRVALIEQGTSAEARELKRLMSAVFARFERDCSDCNLACAVIVIPAALDMLDAPVETASAPESGYERCALSRAYSVLAQGAGLACLDLFEPFWRQGGAQLYLRGFDTHWNARGQACAAELTAEFVLAHKLLAEPAPIERR